MPRGGGGRVAGSAHTAAVVLVDGSQFAPAMEAVLRERFAQPDGYTTLVGGLFQEMFTDRSEKQWSPR